MPRNVKAVSQISTMTKSDGGLSSDAHSEFIYYNRQIVLSGKRQQLSDAWMKYKAN